MKKLALFLMVAAMSAASVSAQPGGSKSNLLFANASLPADALCELKSGIIKYEATSQGNQITVTQCFDDYGKKQSALTETGTAMVKTEVKTLQFGDTVYQINLGMKMGQKTVLPEKPINYLQLTQAVREKYKIQELGSETIAGKQCTKYSLEVTQMGQTVKTEVWVYIDDSLRDPFAVSDDKQGNMLRGLDNDFSADQHLLPDEFQDQGNDKIQPVHVKGHFAGIVDADPEDVKGQRGQQ